MHEFSIVSSLMERVESEATERRAKRVLSINLRIGEAAGVEVELLRTAYELLRDGTICNDAPLHIDVAPVRWACPSCALPPEPGGRLSCPSCGSPVRLMTGDEIMLDRIELEVL